MLRRRNLRPFGIRLLWCEAISSSFFLGAYFESIGIGVAVLGLVALVLHYLLSQYSDDRLISAHITIIWAIAAFFWGSWFDRLAATSYITVILTILVVCISYWGNVQALRWPEIDQWFHTPSEDE